jgi:regulator of sigma E protease
MIDESMDTEQLKEEPKPWEFRSKPAWQRLIIMLGGVFVNFILGIFIYIMLMYSYGEKYLPNENVNDGVWVQDSLAVRLGLQNGDKILSVDGEEIKKFSDITIEFINGNNYTIERNGLSIKKELPVDFIDKLITRGKNAGMIVRPRSPFMFAKFQENSQNSNSEFKDKDIVTAINGQSLKYQDEVEVLLNENRGKEISLTVKRGEENKTFNVVVNDNGKLGVVIYGMNFSDLEKLGYYDLANINYSLAAAIPAGVNKSYETLSNYIKQLKKIFNPNTGAYKGLGGFISIGSIFPSTWSAESFWNITAFLSIMLGFMNLLPIPALDGGHVVFTLWEMITGKKPSDKFLEYAQVTGFILLITLLLFANGNDIFRLFQ